MKNFDNAKFESIKAFTTVNLVQSEVSDIWMLFPWYFRQCIWLYPEYDLKFANQSSKKGLLSSTSVFVIYRISNFWLPLSCKIYIFTCIGNSVILTVDYAPNRSFNRFSMTDFMNIYTLLLFCVKSSETITISSDSSVVINTCAVNEVSSEWFQWADWISFCIFKNNILTTTWHNFLLFSCFLFT